MSLKNISLLVLLVFAVCGCGNDGKGLVSVEGKITLDGGDMPFSGSIRFLPQEVEEGIPRRPATAKFDTDGVYQATSYKPGDGIYPGTYVVTVECWEVPPSMGGESPINAIDPKYQNPKASGLSLTVESSDSNKVFNVSLTSTGTDKN